MDNPTERLVDISLLHKQLIQLPTAREQRIRIHLSEFKKILQMLKPCTLGWSEKHKSWKMQQFKADSEPRHSTDFRTIFGIMIG